jgi:hypothetical protein
MVYSWPGFVEPAGEGVGKKAALLRAAPGSSPGHALAMIEHRDAELLRLVGEIAGDAGAGEDDDVGGFFIGP